MPKVNAGLSGTFRIAGNIEVHRLGFGAMRITGRGVWGPPADRAEAIRALQRLPALGVNFIDTADSYGPDVSEQLIREALHPYTGLTIATKGGLVRPGPDRWTPRSDTQYLIHQARKSCSQLGVEQIGLWQLHRIDPQVPRAEQFSAVRTLLDTGIIRHAGLSEVSIRDIEEASEFFPVATVQNRYKKKTSPRQPLSFQLMNSQVLTRLESVLVHNGDGSFTATLERQQIAHSQLHLTGCSLAACSAS